MRPITVPALALFVTLVLVDHARADIVACGPSVPSTVTCLSGNVSDTAGGGPLVAGKIYHLSVVTVPAGQTLTIEDGAILKFSLFGDLTVLGTLSCGAAIITSQTDDLAGGDTAGDGTTIGQPGDWDGIAFQTNSSASTLSQATIRYAKVGVRLFSADITMDTVTIDFCRDLALDLNANSFPIVTNCSFNNNGFAVTRVSLGAIPGFVGNAATANTDGDYMYVTDTTMTANLTIGPNNSLGFQPFVSCITLNVPANLTLTLLSGTVIKFGQGPPPAIPGCGIEGITVNGTLIADGLTLTSLQDDSIIGDTNKDGGLTMPVPGDWGALTFNANSDASDVKNALMRYPGQAIFAPFVGPSVRLNQADVSLDNLTVDLGADVAMRLNANSFPTVVDCSFNNHPGKAVDRVSLGAVAGFTNNSASMNSGGDYMELLTTGPEIVTGNIVIQKDNSLNSDGVFVVDDDITVEDTGTLTLGGDVVFKWTTPNNHFLNVRGTLDCDGAGISPITFTSLPDDEVVGDTDKSGDTPAPGDWIGITFLPGSDASVLDEVVVRYAGQKEFTPGAVHLSAASPSITATIIERSETAGLSLSSLAFPTVSGNIFRENDRAVTGVAIRAVPGFDNNTATDNTNGDYLEITNGDVAFGAGPSPGVPLTIGPASALLPAAVFVVSDDIDVPAGCLLSMLAGTIIKWDGLFELDVDGSVQLGSLGGTVVLTSCKDDSIGGDTKNDGDTDGTPGDWIGVNVAADGSFFDDVLVRFAGGLGPAFELVNVTAQLQKVRIEDCASTALDLTNNSIPLVDGCEFNRNVFAVDRVPIRALPGFSANTAEDNTVGDYMRITEGIVPFDILVKPSQSLNNGPFVLADDVDVLTGTTLTLDPNVTFKFEGTFEVDVDGVLNCLGAGSPVLFTTLFDDIAGDTNKDGTFTVPGPGAWRGLVFGPDSDASIVTSARVRFPGFGGVAAFDLFQADIILTDSMVESAADSGMDLSGNSFPQVRRTSFDDGLDIPVDFVPLGAVSGFTDNTAGGNAVGDYMRVTSASITEEVTVARYNALNGDGVFVVDTAVSVFAPGVLNLLQGTIFKWQGFSRNLSVSTGSLNVRGTGLEPVVLTPVADDSVGGDTKRDGSTTVPAPGDWGQVSISPTAGPSVLENLVARYGGSGSIRLQSDFAAARSIRADFASGDGIGASRLAGDATNWVAFQNGGDGFDVTGGSFDLIHPTVASNAGFGIRRSGSYTGTLWNANVFGNTAGETSGFLAGEVFFSNADAAFSGFDGNISTDPLFTDSVAGDLTLGAGSRCIDTADFATALNTVIDHVEAPRILDHDLDGTALPDMGAFEKSAYALSFGGQPKLGTVMSFTVSGATPGTAFYGLGLLNGTTFIPPFGFTLFGTLGTQIVLGVAPTGQPIILPIPGSPGFVGTEFGVQGFGQPVGMPGTGNATNRYRGTVFP